MCSRCGNPRKLCGHTRHAAQSILKKLCADADIAQGEGASLLGLPRLGCKSICTKHTHHTYALRWHIQTTRHVGAEAGGDSELDRQHGCTLGPCAPRMPHNGMGVAVGMMADEDTMHIANIVYMVLPSS